MYDVYNPILKNIIDMQYRIMIIHLPSIHDLRLNVDVVLVLPRCIQDLQAEAIIISKGRGALMLQPLIHDY